MSALRALLWDVDGTLAETERDGHRVAFNQAFERLDLPWRWDEAHYGRLLQVAGGFERLLHDMAGRADAPRDAEARERLARELHRIKNRCYGDLLAAGGIGLRPGVRELIDEATDAGLAQAITTTTSPENVEALLAPALGGRWRERFAAVLTAAEAPRKKPDPQVYLMALEHLGLSSREAVALEDSPAGVRAACAAGVAVVVTRSAYFAEASTDGASAVGPSLAQTEGWAPAAAPGPRIGLRQIRAWTATS